MKKVFFASVILLILLSALTFILIPARLTVSSVIMVRTNVSGLYRNLANESKWVGWWPAKEETTTRENVFNFNGFSYRLNKPLYQAVEIVMTNRRANYAGTLLLIPMSTDSVAVNWKTTLETTNNPVSRILNYQAAKKIRNNMKVIMDSMKRFNERIENVYAFHIHRTTIKDTFLVASKIVTATYPTTKEIYTVIGNLRKYITSQGARETNYPMLNVTTNDSIHYTMMVAIPTDKRLEGSGNISLKQMIIYPDKTVTAEVTGGPDSIKKAYRELNVYLNDYILSTPVIHWESLVTDRSKEPDSSKWVTKIFMPVV